ncbi:uncharacterized protein LOC117816219 isoform X1 [Xyrichtys novacula]|uniref:Uncharacterized protein LOC117816219 isoform X1 n=1 Tax=Xyrichtys novacula TaxID=13765 RepID=A0AAV1EXX4_XYRNO|nr:uncharacterized protein LOC117816219 isoform X1 [Xyrichtys novacula]
MGFSALHLLLWLLATVTLTTQELLTIRVTPKIVAACGQQVKLDCEVTSSQHGLSIKHIEWYQNNTSLCRINSEEVITTYHRHTVSDFHCEYQRGKLSIIFKEMKPMDSGDSKPFGCNIRSNKGVKDKSTTVDLQECCGHVEGVMKDGRPDCTFTRVYPDGEVHWFHGSHRLHGHHTGKRVEDGGWLTINSYLERKTSEVPYNCSLWSPKTGTYIASTLIKKRPKTNPLLGNGAGSYEPAWTFGFVAVLLVVSLK